MFSLRRFGAVLYKEFIQMRRDRITFAMMIGLPIVQLMLFGFAINADPRHLPTLVEVNDSGPLTRAVLAGMANSTYFDFTGPAANAESHRALRALGCSIMQGFLFSRPLPPDDLELWLRQTLLARNAVWIEQ